MRGRAVLLSIVAAFTFALTVASAGAETQPVTLEFQSYAPDTLDALPGDVISWNNSSSRTHTVTADGGQFDSDDLAPGQQFSTTLLTPGTYTYHCTIHRGMIGEIDVRQVTLDPLPPSAVVRNTDLAISGRTADIHLPVVVQADTGAGFRTVTTVSPNGDGSWAATVAATKSGRYRAMSGTGLSETRQLLVIDRTVKVRLTQTGLAVRVLPASPYGLIALQFRLRDRFGWWTVVQRRLDYVSSASFRLPHHGPVLARVVLLGPDHWTPVAISRPVHLNRH
jgi:plastocyanin